MEWVSHKIDTFLAAVVIAIAAIAASQCAAFESQYLHRLGGQLDDARTQVASVETGLRYKLMSDTVRGEIESNVRGRAHSLQTAYDAVADTNIFARPIALVRSGDHDLLQMTWKDFVPGVPSTAEGVAYVVIGAIIGFVLYEIIKLPVMLLLREPRRRKFRRRG